MGLLKQLMIFGKSGLQGLPTRVALFPWAFSRRGATGFPLLTTWDSVAGLGRAPIPENISGRKLTRVLNSAGSVLVHLRYVTKRPRTGEGCDPGNSGFWERDYGWGVRVHRPFGAHGMSSVRYGTRLGDLKNKQSTESQVLLLCRKVISQRKNQRETSCRFVRCRGCVRAQRMSRAVLAAAAW